VRPPPGGVGGAARERGRRRVGVFLYLLAWVR
jgi:hypothetical protein